MDSDASVGDYEVFLSFRGADTRQAFTAILYEYMTMAEIRVFRDDDELAIGDEIDSILEAIDRSRICIPIFSPRFAESKWCLREVSRMVELEKTIVPVFYKVSPDDVKLKTSLYSAAFKKLEESHGNHEEIAKWKNALKKAASIKGRELGEKSYPKYCKELVDEVLSKLGPRTRLEIDQFVGVDNKASALKLLDIGSSSKEVVFVGMYGMGGIGKTTLTKLIYNEFLSSFDHCSFVPDIRDFSRSSKGVNGLPEYLFDNLQPKSVTRFTRSKQIPDVFNNKKVLIILDDVDSYEQIKKIAREPSWFGSGSRIILTTRDKKVLDDYREEGRGKIRYLEMEGLPSRWALELFSKCAFGTVSSPSAYQDLSKRAVSYAGGLPLAITVIAKYLRNKKDEVVWEDIIERLKRTPPKEVKDKLMISYEALEDEAKKIFLDIACLFIGERFTETSNVFYMWQACGLFPRWSLEILQSRSLVKVVEGSSYSSVLWMHDQLRDLGRDIVRSKCEGDLTKQSRLWEHSQAVDVLKCKKKQKNKIELLQTSRNHCDEELFVLDEELSVSFEKLRYLSLGRLSKLQGDFSSLLPQLRWLSCSHILEARNLSPSNLVILDLSRSDIDENCDTLGQIQVLKKLKVLDLSGCRSLRRTPVFADNMPLERLNLYNCTSLAYIDPSIGKLHHLNYLGLSSCVSLLELPEESLAGLHSLQELDLQYSKIAALPDSIGLLANLERLNLNHCKNILTLPDSLGKLHHLNYLCLSLCLSLRVLSEESLAGLHSLQELDLQYSEIAALPDSIGLLANLERLDLSDCEELQTLPDSLGKLKSLQELNLEESGITELPESIGGLEKLTKLELSNSKISQLPSSIDQCSLLEILMLVGCDHLQELPELPTSLEVLEVNGCKNLKNPPESLGNLHSLRELNLGGTSITTLPDSIGLLANLERLDLSDCEELQTLPDSLGKLKSLQELNLEESGITELPESIGGLEKLTKLELSNSKISQLPSSIDQCSFLKILMLVGCDHLQELPELPTRLEVLEVNGCKNLKNLLESLGNLHSLRELNLGGTSITTLPDSIGLLENLERLDLSYWEELQTLPDSLGKLKSLHELNLEESGITELPESIGLLANLERLYLKSCKKIQSLPDSLGKLKSLQVLNLSYSGLTELPESIGFLANLELLYLKSCKNLKNFPESFGNLHSLRKFSFEGTSITTLPDSVGLLANLEWLYLKSCEKIQSLPDSLWKLKSLQVLDLSYSGITALPESIGGLEKLSELELSGTKISQLPSSINQLSLLKILKLERCDHLQELPELPTSLEVVNGRSNILKVLPDLSGLRKLLSLRIESCYKLIEIPGIGKLKSLTDLYIRDCPALVSLENLGELKELRTFSLILCQKLTGIPGLGKLRSLTVLSVEDCDSIERLENIEGLEVLEQLSLIGCRKLIPGLANLKSLRIFNGKTVVSALHYLHDQASCSEHGNLATEQSEVEDSPLRKRKRD